MRIRRCSSLSICLAATLAGAAHAEVPGIKNGAQMTRELAAEMSDISTHELQREIARNPELVLTDIRMPDEIRGVAAPSGPRRTSTSRADGSNSRSPGALPARTPPSSCTAAPTSAAAGRLHAAADGNTNVKNYADGFIGWKRQGLPIE